MHVHAATRLVLQGLGHEARVHPVHVGHFLHDHLVGHHGVGHAHGVAVAQVDLVLARPVFVMAILHRNAHALQGEHRVAAQVARRIKGGKVEVAAAVERFAAAAVAEVEVLDFGAHVCLVAGGAHPGDLAGQYGAAVPLKGLQVRRFDAAEHARDGVAIGAPRQDLEGGRIREGEHVAFGRVGEAVDAARIEAHTFGEGAFQFVGAHGERLHAPHHVGKPEAHEMHVTRLDRAHHVFLIGRHRRILSVAKPACRRTCAHPRDRARSLCTYCMNTPFRND